MSHAWIPLGTLVHPPGSSADRPRTTAPLFVWHGPRDTPPPPSPSPVQTLPSPPSHSSSSSSVVPSNGMIAVADICCLSWWSCVKGEGNGNKGKGVGGRCGEGKTEWRQRDRLEGWRGQREGNRLERAAESRFGYRWSRNSVTSTVHLSCRGFFVKPIMSRVPSSAP